MANYWYSTNRYSRFYPPKKKKEKVVRVIVDHSNILNWANTLSVRDIKSPSDILLAKKILRHPEVHKKSDTHKQTALHILAIKGYHQVLKNEYVDKVLDIHKRSPLFYLVASNLNNKDIVRMCRSFIVKHYPWYPLGTEEISPGLIDKVLNCVNAEKFIFGLSDE